MAVEPLLNALRDVLVKLLLLNLEVIPIFRNTKYTYFSNIYVCEQLTVSTYLLLYTFSNAE